MISKKVPIRVGIYQPVIPDYRVPLFTALNLHPQISLEVFASQYCYGFQMTAQNDFKFQFNPVKAKGIGKGIYWQYTLRIPSYFRQGDVIVISGMPKFLNIYPLMISAKIRRIGIVWWGHGYTAGSRGLSVTIRQRIMRLADVILLYTEKEVDEYRRVGFSSYRLFSTNNTINTSEIEIAKKKWVGKKIRAFKKEHGLLNTKNLIFCGRLLPKAHLEIALEALVELLSKDPDYRLIVIGDGEEKENLVECAQKLNIAHSVHWLGSIYDQFELAPWFLSSFLFIYPGSIGLSLLHAYAFDLPVITHDRSELHMPEIAAFKDNMNGLVFKYGNPHDMALKIQYLSKKFSKIIYMRENVKGTINGAYSFDGMVERFIKAVNSASLMANNCDDKNKLLKII